MVIENLQRDIKEASKLLTITHYITDDNPVCACGVDIRNTPSSGEAKEYWSSDKRLVNCKGCIESISVSAAESSEGAKTID